MIEPKVDGKAAEGVDEGLGGPDVHEHLGLVVGDPPGHQDVSPDDRVERR